VFPFLNGAGAMGLISDLTVLDFLNWLRTERSEITSLQALSDAEFTELLRQYVRSRPSAILRPSIISSLLAGSSTFREKVEAAVK
jgi:hypothetical protein